MAKAKPVTNSDKMPAKEKTVLYIEQNVLACLKYIEYKDDRTRTDVLNEALTDFISRWEKRTGRYLRRGDSTCAMNNQSL